MNVPAPRSVHARIVVNGQYTGLYAMVEQIDGRFTRQNFVNGKDNLYKEQWPLDDQGKPFSEAVYKKALKTNEDEDPSVEMIRSFAEEIEAAADDSLKSVVRKWMDVDEIIAYAVVGRMIRVDDGGYAITLILLEQMFCS